MITCTYMQLQTAHKTPVTRRDIRDIATNTTHKPREKIIAPIKDSKPVCMENLRFIPPMDGTKVASITEENATPINASHI